MNATAADVGASDLIWVGVNLGSPSGLQLKQMDRCGRTHPRTVWRSVASVPASLLSPPLHQFPSPGCLFLSPHAHVFHLYSLQPLWHTPLPWWKDEINSLSALSLFISVSTQRFLPSASNPLIFSQHYISPSAPCGYINCIHTDLPPSLLVKIAVFWCVCFLSSLFVCLFVSVSYFSLLYGPCHAQSDRMVPLLSR